MLLDRYHEQTRGNELLAGIVAATIANFSFGRGEEPLKATDFMPSEQAKKQAEREKKPRVKRKRKATLVDIREFLQSRTTHIA